jgi:hypothetical protein
MKGQVIFLGKEQREIKKVPINKLKYKEDKIKTKSIQIFNDDDPCIIHKTYCINALSLELLNKLEEMGEERINRFYTEKTILEAIKDYIEFPNEAKYIKFI